MDGVGIRESSKGNALKNANTKTLDSLMEEYPHILLNASGEELAKSIILAKIRKFHFIIESTTENINTLLFCATSLQI